MTHCHPQHVKVSRRGAKSKTGGKKIGPMIGAFLVIGAVAFLLVRLSGDRLGASVNDASDGTALLAIEPLEIDLGTVPISGGVVERTFRLANTGTASLRIAKIQTSCMCTTAQLETNGKKSPIFGMAGHGGVGAAPRSWSQEIPTGGEGTLRVFYDPNAHGPAGVGPFERAVLFGTNDPAHESVELLISGVVTR